MFTQQELHERLQAICIKGAKMRTAQKNYFSKRKAGYNAEAELNEAKKTEREFDRFIEETAAIMANPQAALFL